MNRKQSFAAFIGLDKSDKKINVSLQPCGQSKIERGSFKAAPKRFMPGWRCCAHGSLGNEWPSVSSNRQPGSSTRSWVMILLCSSH